MKYKWGSPVCRNAVLLLTAGILLGVGILIYDLGNRRLEQDYYLDRPDPGSGTENETLIVETPFGNKEMEITVEEQKLEKDAIRQQLVEMADKLSGMILGKNESLDEIRFPLEFVQEMEGYPISVEWRPDADGPIRKDGSLDQTKIEEAGVLTGICARLQWDEEVVVTEFYVRVYPEPMSEEARFMEGLRTEIESSEKRSVYERKKELPREAEGETLHWYKPMDTRGFLVLLLSAAGAALYVEYDRNKKKEEEKERRLQLELDYPELLSKLRLYMESGLTCRSAFMKIAGDYKKKQSVNKTYSRIVYEEMVKTGYEMQSGVSEQQAYARFGERCRVPCYKKLTGLLIQNARKGTKGLSNLLEAEMWQAFENRKSLAKRQAEETGTKLLFPMIGMLAVIMVIVIAPALMSMQM